MSNPGHLCWEWSINTCHNNFWLLQNLQWMWTIPTNHELHHQIMDLALTPLFLAIWTCESPIHLLAHAMKWRICWVFLTRPGLPQITVTSLSWDSLSQSQIVTNDNKYIILYGIDFYLGHFCCWSHFVWLCWELEISEMCHKWQLVHSCTEVAGSHLTDHYPAVFIKVSNPGWQKEGKKTRDVYTEFSQVLPDWAGHRWGAAQWGLARLMLVHSSWTKFTNALCHRRGQLWIMGSKLTKRGNVPLCHSSGPWAGFIIHGALRQRNNPLMKAHFCS